MAKTLLKLGTVVTMDRDRRVIEGGGILIEGTRIEKVLREDELPALPALDTDVMSARTLVAIPGFVQTHIHLCQTLFRGLADELELLDWLRLKIFPFEAAHTEASVFASAMVGIAELVRSGTTTIMDMGALRHEDEVIHAIEKSGIRAFVGKSMMDINDITPSYKESTKESLKSTLRQAESWHGAAGGRIHYAVAPRFVLSCSEALLRESYAMTESFPGMLFHTHASENRREMDEVWRRCGMGNVAYFDAIGVLKENSCLAHCIWLEEKEAEMIAARSAKVLHCPTSNLKLGSGIAGIPGFLKRGITVSLGADGAPCNNRLDMFQEMRLATLIQTPVHGPSAIRAQTIVEMATVAGAETLGLGHEIGSIEEGKKADIVLLDLERLQNPYHKNDVYSAIVHSGSPENVHSVMVDGSWVYRDRAHLFVDEGRLREDASNELRKLLPRVH
jgi:5-methylthioadenosine/S-adenosylhomocysteine deaminase